MTVNINFKWNKLLFYAIHFLGLGLGSCVGGV